MMRIFLALLFALAVASCQAGSDTGTEDAAAGDARESEVAPVADARDVADPAATEAMSQAPADEDLAAETTASAPPEAVTDSAATTTPSPEPTPEPSPVPEPAPAPTAPDPAMAAAPADTTRAFPRPADGEGASAEKPAAKASLTVSPSVYNGWKQFAANCERCHGQDAVGSSFAPSLVTSMGESSKLTGQPLTKEQTIETITKGRLDKGMPAWADLLSAEAIQDIHNYLRARGDGQLPPGRPTRAG